MNPVLRLIPLFSKQQSHLFSKQIPVFMNQSRTFTYSSFLHSFSSWCSNILTDSFKYHQVVDKTLGDLDAKLDSLDEYVDEADVVLSVCIINTTTHLHV